MSAGSGSAQMDLLVRSVDFERVLGMRTRMLSAHFAVHYLAGVPCPPRKVALEPIDADLSTGGCPNLMRAVDDPRVAASGLPTAGLTLPSGPRRWFGAVVPKRHARRAVTRTLLKRQIRVAILVHAESMAAGLWVVRLRAAFDRATFNSASSRALRRAARDELDRLLLRCAAPAAG